MGVILSFTKVTSERLSHLIAAGPQAQEELWQLERADDDPSGYLDKAWDGLRYLLEEAETGVDLCDSGVPLDSEEYYGWPADLVGSTAERLRDTPFTALAAHYDPAAMDAANVYPGIWTRDGDAALGYLRIHYATLAAFFADAAKSGSAAVMHFG
ncbi:YfbM family protein [Nocardia lijiangensis]|uniref:YfbM family protein n=1 Tax=Nocardia lijiangensis TaxID=299618 RepID=UPI00082A473F|nr:YfbM family protein [Nocardia lijiangensis]